MPSRASAYFAVSPVGAVGLSVFGQAYDGMDVVDEIAKTRVDLMDKPFDDVVIEKIEIGEYEG